MESNFTLSKKRITTKDVVITGLLIAIVFVATYVIQFRLPISVNGGLVHTGNVALFTAAIVFGKRKGAVAGAFGMALFDVLSGWMAWSPFTFIIRFAMGYIVGTFAYMNGKKGKNVMLNLAGIIIASIVMIVGYYFAEVILYGNWITPFTSIPGNIAQLVVGVVLGLPLSAALKATKAFDKF